jgi:hypothetical protein
MECSERWERSPEKFVQEVRSCGAKKCSGNRRNFRALKMVKTYNHLQVVAELSVPGSSCFLVRSDQVNERHLNSF